VRRHHSRRNFLKAGAACVAFPATFLSACKNQKPPDTLLSADENSVRLPQGFTSRLIAQSGERVHPDSPYQWHAAPDGGGTVALDDGGWLYISNSEMPKKGKVGVIRFNGAAEIVSAYSILEGGNRNCGGCVTPWGSWLSCEEVHNGRVWECDPMGKNPAMVRTQMGIFKHESAVVEPSTLKIYMTEDEKDGCLYRFTPNISDNGAVDLSQGLLEVAIGISGEPDKLAWEIVPDPNADTIPTRYQVKQRRVFRGGEGICYYDGKVYFTTKRDNRVWVLYVNNSTIQVIYDGNKKDKNTGSYGILQGVDALVADRLGSLYVAEDGGDFQVVKLTHDGRTRAVAQLASQGLSEVTGVAFNPDYTRLYFSSQRGFLGAPEGGRTYEVTGPFHSL